MELFDEIKAHISQRMSNPFTPAFLISWSVWNYKTLILLFSGMNPIMKIIKIEDLYAWDGWYHNGWVQGLLMPAILAAAYVGASPYVSRKILVFWKTQENATKERLVTLEDKTPLSRAELDSIKAELQKQIDDLQDKLEKRESTIARHENTIESRDQRIQEHLKSLENLRSEFRKVSDGAAEERSKAAALEEQLKAGKKHSDSVTTANAELRDRLERASRLLTDDERINLLNNPEFPPKDFRPERCEVITPTLGEIYKPRDSGG